MANIREITYYDVSPYAALSAKSNTPNNIQNFSDPQKLFAENMIYRNIQTCEHNQTILDGSHREFEKGENIALWSKSQSAYPSRLLPESVTLDVTFGGLQSSPGIAFYFDSRNNIWCDALRVKWHKDGSLLADEIFYPDAPVYSCVNKVDLYNRVTIEFMRLNMPRRYLKIEAVLFGIVRVFGDGDLENMTINEGFDPTGRTLHINSANFTVNTKDPVPYIFLKRQPLHIRRSGVYIGAYYIDKSKKHADRRYSIEAIDKIGVLDASDAFMGGIYNNIYAETLINQIAGRLFDVEIDDGLKTAGITGWLPVLSRRDALAQVAVALGAMIDTSRANCIKVKPMPVSGGPARLIGRDRVYQSGSVDIEFPCTGIELTEHNFSIGRESKELYKDIFTGEKTVIFPEPATNLTISNGAVLSSGANYAVITSSGGAECELNGQPYIDSMSAVTLRGEIYDMLEGTQEKIEKIENCYLVNKNNSQAVARRLYDYYVRQNVFDGEFLLGEGENAERTGDTVSIAAAFDEDVTGQIEKLTFRPGIKNIKARGIIRSE